MHTHQPTSTNHEALNPGLGSTTPATDTEPMLWVARGILVGLILGASAGSVIPVYGTAIGGVGGTVAGFLIGLLTAVFAAATRAWLPADAETIELRERIACLVFIWSPLIIARGAWAAFLAAAAFLGSLHAIAAGTPVGGAVYTGKVSDSRRTVCIGLPFVILVLIAIGWAIAAIN